MSDLQLAMIVLGVALVVAVWFYNLWVEKQHRQRAERMLPKAQDDVLKASEPGKTEPGIAPLADDEPALRTIPEARPLQPSSSPAAVPPEPSFMDADLPLEPEMAALTDAAEVDLLLDIEESAPEVEPVPLPDEWGDGRADCLLRVEFVAPVPVPLLWEEHREWSARVDKPIQWLGLDEKSGHWRTLLPQDSGSVKHLAVALQLVDRLGAASEETLKAFIEGIARLAQHFVGQVEIPSVADLLGRAQELDAFCASVDLQLSVHVLPQGTTHMSGALLKPLLEQSGLQLEGERFVALDESGVEAFALICRSATSYPAERVAAMDLIDLIFSLDVPRVAAGVQTFGRMIEFARACAATLGGQLADAHRKPLPEATVATIRGRIEELQNRMAERGIAAGGVRALRLFS